MRIEHSHFDAIMDGSKSLEVRVGDSSIERFNSRDIVQLVTDRTSGIVRIKALRVYPNFEDMLALEDWRKIFPQCNSADETLDLLRRMYDLVEEALGVYVLEMEKLSC